MRTFTEWGPQESSEFDPLAKFFVLVFLIHARSWLIEDVLHARCCFNMY